MMIVVVELVSVPVTTVVVAVDGEVSDEISVPVLVVVVTVADVDPTV